MLKVDRIAFSKFVSGNLDELVEAVAYFEALDLGHLEDHPLSRKMVRENLSRLIEIWHRNEIPEARAWVLQFIADAGVASVETKPLVVSALALSNCTFLPTVLWLMCSAPALFADAGEHLKRLAAHRDPQVRWRVACFISKVFQPDSEMAETVSILENDPEPLTRTYVNLIRAKA